MQLVTREEIIVSLFKKNLNMCENLDFQSVFAAR